MAKVEELEIVNPARQSEELKGVCKDAAKLFKILSNPVRLEILCHILSSKEICVKILQNSSAGGRQMSPSTWQF